MAKLTAAKMERRSPNGFTSMLKLLLNITHATPINAIIDPTMKPLLSCSVLYIIFVSSTVMIGDSVTSRDTLVTSVYCNAVFSPM